MSDERRNDVPSPLRLIAGSLVRPSQWGQALEELADHFRTWRAGRRWSALWAGLPALVVLAAAACVSLILVCTPRHARVRSYLDKADRAARDGDSARALLSRLRVVREVPAALDHQLSLAEAYRDLRDMRSYASLLSMLAPDGETRYGPAHFLRARELIAVPGAGPIERAAAEKHLKRALEANPKHADAQVLLGRLEALDGRLHAAEGRFSEVLADRPVIGLELARVYLRQGKQARARQTGEEARDFLRRASAARPDDVEIRLALADASMFLEDFPAALATLEEGRRLGDRPAFRQAMARVYVFWSDAEKRSPDGRIGGRIELLEQGIRADPDEPLLFSRLVDVLQGETAAEGDRLRALLERMLAEGRSLPLVHLVLGTHHLAKGRLADARLHLEQALRLDPNSVTAANNLAWTLAHAEPPDLATALVLIEEVVRTNPNFASCRDTRGTILAKLGRWEEALVDLETALPSMRNSPDLHRTLAEVYGRLDRPALAAEHQRTAERLSNAIKP